MTPDTEKLKALAEGALSKAAMDVLAERERQKGVEGWTEAHDDEHTDYSLAQAAATYAMGVTVPNVERSVMDSHGNSGTIYDIKKLWPISWSWAHFKPKNRRRDLVKAGALIIAEIERLDREEPTL